jgi:1-acyl-sn-glycerol-3-phosphate acyltransferase
VQRPAAAEKMEKAAARTVGVSRVKLWRHALADAGNTAVVAGSSLALIGSFFWLPPFLYHYYKRKCTTRKRKAAFVALLALIVLYPLRPRRSVTKSCLWDFFSRYFDVKVRGDVNAIQGRQALFAFSPHGIFPFSLALGALGKLNETVFGNLRPVVATAIYHVPIIGHILKLMGAVTAGPNSFNRALDEGFSLGLAPGGIGEIFRDPDEHNEFALLRDRKGFILRAMQRGIPLVPVFVFGSSHTFHRLKLPWAFEYLSRLLRVTLVLFWGRWGLPIPFRVPLTFAVGNPIEVERVTGEITESAVAEVHVRFCRELERIFEKYKDEYGWGGRSLNVV